MPRSRDEPRRQNARLDRRFTCFPSGGELGDVVSFLTLRGYIVVEVGQAVQKTSDLLTQLIALAGARRFSARDTP
jgi:hypothetical protein